MQGLICDNCGEGRAAEKTVGWIVMARMQPPEQHPLMLQILQAHNQEEQPEPKPADEEHPLDTNRHFCSEVCVKAWVNAGMQPSIHLDIS